MEAPPLQQLLLNCEDYDPDKKGNLYLTSKPVFYKKILLMAVIIYLINKM